MAYGWVVVAFTLLFQGVSFGILIYSFALFVVPWLEDFGATPGHAMFAIAALQLGIGWSSPLVGRGLDRVPPRWLLTTGAGLLALGLLATARVSALWQIVVLYATILPVGLTLTGPLSAQTLVTRWFTGRRGLAVGVSATGTSLGGFVVPVVVGGLMAEHGWRTTLDWLALAVLVAIVPLALVVLRPTPPVVAAGAHADTPEVRLDSRLWTTAEVFRARTFRVMVLAFLPVNAAFGGVQFNLGAYARDLGLPPERVAWLISAIAISMVFGKFVFGGLADRVDHRRLYWVAAGCMLLALLLIRSEPSFVRLALASVTVGLAAGGILPLLAVIVASRFGALSFGRVMGLVTMFLTLAAFGSLLAGWIRDATGSYDIAFAVFALLLLPAAVVMRWLPPARPGAG